jgi:hypothetical protein
VDFRASSVLTASLFFHQIYDFFFFHPLFFSLVVFHKKIVILPTPSAFINESLTLTHILPSFYLFFTLFLHPYLRLLMILHLAKYLLHSQNESYVLR